MKLLQLHTKMFYAALSHKTWLRPIYFWNPPKCFWKVTLFFSIMTLLKSEVFDNHKSILRWFGTTVTNKDMHSPNSYWIPSLHMDPYKYIYIWVNMLPSRCLLSWQKMFTVVKSMKGYINSVRLSTREVVRMTSIFLYS